MGKSSFELLQELQKNKAKTAKKVKKTEKSEKSNQNKDIMGLVDPNDVDEVIGQVASTSKDRMRDKFILYWLLGYSVRSAGIAAGYKASTVHSGKLYKWLKSSIVKERLEKISGVIPEKYRALCRLRLTDVGEIEASVLKLMKDDPEKALRHPQMLKQVKQAAGVLVEEVIPAQTVNIESLKIMQQINLRECESRLKVLEDKEKVIDVTPSQD